jgi:HEAT repeats
MRRLTLLLVLLAFACDAAKKDWRAAAQANTVAGYERFIAQHPKSAEASEAEKRIADLQRKAEIDSALIAGTPAALERVAAKYPRDPATAKVREKLAAFAAAERAKLQELLDARQPAFREVKTVRLDIKEDYGEAKKTTLDFRNELVAALGYANVRVVESEADATITVRANGEPLDSRYTSFGGGPARTLYSGADLDGTMTLIAGEGKISESFSAHIGTPFTVSSYSTIGPTSPDDAPFEKAFAKCVPDAVRRMVLRAFGAPPLFAELSASHGRNQAAAARALGRMSPPPVERLLAMLSSPNASQRNAAVEGLAKAGADAALLAALANTSDDVRCSAIDGLARFAEPVVLAAIVERASDPSTRVRTCAAKVLGEQPSGDEEYEERVTNLLNETRSAGIVRGLVKALVANTGESRDHIIEALAKTDPDISTPLLIPMIDGDDRNARIAAIDAAGRFFGDDRAVPSLIKALSAPDDGVRDAAVMALGNIGDGRAVKPLKALKAAGKSVAGVDIALQTIADREGM